MMRLCKLALVLGVAALVAGPALAQRGRGGMGGAPPLATFVTNKSVVEALKLDKDTTDKIAEALKKQREDLKDEYATSGRGSTASDEDKAAARKKIAEATDKTLKSVLKDDQVARLHQMRNFAMGFAIFQDTAAREKLKLSDKQKDEVKDLAKDHDKDLADAFGGQKPSNDEERQARTKKIQGINQDYLAKGTKILDDSQKKTLDELVGKPFDYKPEFGGGRGGRGGKPNTDF